jgi:hypothetical protein
VDEGGSVEKNKTHQAGSREATAATDPSAAVLNPPRRSSAIEVRSGHLPGAMLLPERLHHQPRRNNKLLDDDSRVWGPVHSSFVVGRRSWESLQSPRARRLRRVETEVQTALPQRLMGVPRDLA